MDNEKNKNIDLDEQTADEEALKEVNDDDLRLELAEELGLDPESEEQSKVLDTMIERERKNREMLSGAIRQKRKWRDRAESKFDDEKADDSEGKNSKSGDSEDNDKSFDEKFEEKMAEIELKRMNLPDNIEQEVRDLAKLKGISVREAAEHPFIVQMKADYEKEERVKGATPRRSKRGSYVSSVDPSKPLNPEDPRYEGFSTKDGVEKWNKDKAARARWKAENA